MARTAADRAHARIMVAAAAERQVAAQDRLAASAKSISAVKRDILNTKARRHDHRHAAYLEAADIIRQELTREADTGKPYVGPGEGCDPEGTPEPVARRHSPG
jgi:hypothetical protein